MKIIYLIFVTLFVILFVATVVAFRKLQAQDERRESIGLMLNAFVGMYYSVHLIDISTDTFEELSSSDSIDSVIGSEFFHDKAQYRFRMVMDSLTDPRFKAGIFDFIDLSTLDERLKGKKSVSKEFISYMNDRCVARFIPVRWDESGKLVKVLWTVEIIRDDGDK